MTGKKKKNRGILSCFRDGLRHKEVSSQEEAEDKMSLRDNLGHFRHQGIQF